MPGENYVRIKRMGVDTQYPLTTIRTFSIKKVIQDNNLSPIQSYTVTVNSVVIFDSTTLPNIIQTDILQILNTNTTPQGSGSFGNSTSVGVR